METPDLLAAMERAVAAIDQPCRSQLSERNLIQRRADGWWGIGVAWTEDGRRAWQVWWHPETGRGYLWAMVVTVGGVRPRTFEPPQGS